MKRADIVQRDKAHVWHPYTPMDEWAHADPIVVGRAEGATLHDVDGRSYLDGNSSWWVATLGHGHPRLLAALEAQARALAHCALGGITHEPAARLAEELVAIAPPGLSRVFYVDDGSTAIDAAIKMCVQGWRQRGAPDKTRFIALDGAFHGDTVGATSLGGVDVYRRLYRGVTFDCVHAPFPEPGAHMRAIEAIGELLAAGKGMVAAVFVEPVVQGASGMRVYDPGLLRGLRAACDAHGAWLVTDEVFTGYGRTGAMWAIEHAGVSPDIMCIGKAMAAIVPMGAVLVSEQVMAAFRGGRERAFLHGHTFCGNPIGAALSREVLAIYRDEDVVGQCKRKARVIERAFARLTKSALVLRVRTQGMIGAADLEDSRSGYLGATGWRVYEEALARGAYLRPMGSTVYVCPPLTISDADLDRLLAILEESIAASAARD